VNKKKILFVSDSAEISGAEFVLLNILKSLDRDRYSPYLFCNGKNTHLQHEAEKIGISCMKSFHFPQLARIDKSGVSLSKVAAYLRASAAIYCEMRHVIHAENIDLTYANAYPCCLYCLLPALLSRKPLVWHVHNMRRTTPLSRPIYRIVGAVCERIITVSEACRTNLLQASLSASKIKTIYNGLDLSRFRRKGNGQSFREEFKIRPHTKVIGLMGQPLPEKGHRYFVEAAAEVLKTDPDVKFLIVGHMYADSYHQELTSLVKKLDLESEIIFTGWRSDAPSVLESLDILAHARITPEPAALVLMEAMAMGVPVVASKTGGTSELILDGKTGILFPPKDSHALAQAVVRLIKNPERANRMGQRGRQRMEEKFTLSKQMEAIEGLWDEILNR
jgi:glycosyltransferase involved in cell wall biosynthesis